MFTQTDFKRLLAAVTQVMTEGTQLQEKRNSDQHWEEEWIRISTG